MSKRFLGNALAVFTLVHIAAFADVVLTGTGDMDPGFAFSLDTGAAGITGGDISWNGTSINFVKSAIGFDLVGDGQSGYASLTQSALSTYVSQLSASAITPAANDVLVVQTNGGNLAEVLINSITGGTLVFTFTTYSPSTGGGTPGGPTITSVVNNYSYTPAGFPNSGIAPGTIFTIFGSGMANKPSGNVTLESSAGQGIPKTLAGTSLSVTVGGTTVTPAMYYATPGQIAAVLPSSTPTGAATLTVTYNNTPSNSFSFQVVPSALGLDTYYGTGTGLITATNSTTGAAYNYTNSASPGEIVVLWASGLGADTADSDTVFTTTPHAVNASLQIYFGGVPGTILYAGSSGYPGLDQIDVKIPANVPLSCYVGVVGVTGTGSSLTTSNFGSLAIAQDGGECNDSVFGVSGSIVGTLSGQSIVKYADLFVGQLIEPTSATDDTPQTANLASGDFQELNGSSFGATSGTEYSTGSCVVTEVASTAGPIPFNGLDAGKITLAGPNGNYSLLKIGVGSYSVFPMLPGTAITSSGGVFTFTGSGGTQVGSLQRDSQYSQPDSSLDQSKRRGDG